MPEERDLGARARAILESEFMSDRDVEIFKVLREAHDKYTYFMLAAVGAAITVVLNRTQSAQLEWSQVPLAVAVVAWGLSFYFGTRRLHYGHLSLGMNAELLKVLAGEHPKVGPNQQMIQMARAALIEDMGRLASRATRSERLQFSLLMIGAMSYICWHILEMYLRTIKSA